MSNGCLVAFFQRLISSDDHAYVHHLIDFMHKSMELSRFAYLPYIGIVELIVGPLVFFSVLDGGIFLHFDIMF